MNSSRAQCQDKKCESLSALSLYFTGVLVATNHIDATNCSNSLS